MSSSAFAQIPSSSHQSQLLVPRPYTPRHKTFPYKDSDFYRQDESSDGDFYDSPRFVTHIDDHAISCLRKYYASVLPRHGRILDFCSSWISHYPPEVEEAIKKGELVVTGMGMSKAELARNAMLKDKVVRDLNELPEVVPPSSAGIAGEVELYDAATCVVSIDYLTKPVAVLSSLLRYMKDGGSVHLAISNRCFPTKAVSRWLRVSEEERLQMVGDFLWFAGWREIEILVLSDGTVEGEEANVGGVSGFMRAMGLMGGGVDPLWVVRGKKIGVDTSKEKI